MGNIISYHSLLPGPSLVEGRDVGDVESFPLVCTFSLLALVAGVPISSGCENIQSIARSTLLLCYPRKHKIYVLQTVYYMIIMLDESEVNRSGF